MVSCECEAWTLCQNGAYVECVWE